MFNIEKIKAQLIVGAVVVVAFLSLGWVAKHYYDANLLNESTIKDLRDTNKELNHQIDLFKESKKINDDIIAEQRSTLEKLTALNGEHRAQVSAEVKKILDKYGKLPPSSDNQNQMAVEVSSVRVLGLWKTYCVSHPEFPICEQFRKG